MAGVQEPTRLAASGRRWAMLLPPLLLLGGVAVACLVGEVASRLVWSPPSRARAAPVFRPSSLAALPELTTVFQLATPNVRGVHKGFLYRTNSAGFRGPEYDRTKAADTFRIVVVGDSFTMGSGVAEEEAYPAVVERKLDAGGRRPHVEVLNLGLAGLNLGQIVDRLDTVGRQFAPDLVVYGFTINDIEGPAYRVTRTVSLAGEDARWGRFADSPSYLLRLLWPGWLSVTDIVFPRPGSYPYELVDNYFHNPAAWAGFTAGLDRLAAIARADDVCVHVLVHTVIHHLRASHALSPIYERVASAATERGLTVTQSFPVFRGRDEHALLVSTLDPHPSAAGHRLLARALVSGLLRLPAHCRDRAGARLGERQRPDPGPTMRGNARESGVFRRPQPGFASTALRDPTRSASERSGHRMEVLWAPWRMTYVAHAKEANACIFCAAAGGDPRERLLLGTTPHSLVMLNRFPYQSGHLMVAPRGHTADLAALPAAEHADLADTLRRALATLDGAIHPEGFNVGMNLGAAAGAGVVDHLHWHVVPRWTGDTNFMPVLAGVRVMPQHLLETYDRLRTAFTWLAREPDASS